MDRTLIAVFSIFLLSRSFAVDLKLVAHDGRAEHSFGFSVAMDPNMILVGAPGYLLDGGYRGAVYVFERDGFEWEESQKLEMYNDGPYDTFGYALAKSGSRAIISASGDGHVNLLSGVAFIIERQKDRSWDLSAKLTSGPFFPEDMFGVSVDIDGDYAIVGAPLEGGRRDKCGSAYIFQFKDGEWKLDDKIFPAQGFCKDCFGCAVSISGERAIVGASGSPVKSTGTILNVKKVGTAYIFERKGDGWQQVSKLSPVDGNSGNLFGCSVDIDGRYAIVGACQDNVLEFNSGSAYIYKRQGGSWAEEIKLTAMDADSGDFFGAAVSIFQDKVVVGAPGVNGLGKNSGAIYSFLRGDEGWVQRARKTPYDAADHDIFGTSVAMSQDLSIIGAPSKSVRGRDCQGVAYIYDNIDDLALPVELSSFSAKLEGNAVHLQWTTQSEKDNLGFVIERKTADTWHLLSSFQTHDELRGQGTSSMPTSYEFFDDSIRVNMTYHYRLADINMNGSKTYHDPIEITISSGINERLSHIPQTCRVLPAFPNPFNPETVIRYELPKTAFVCVHVYDMMGKKVRTLLSQQQPPGYHAVRWDGTDEAGIRLSSSVYIVQFQAGDVVRTRKVVLMQ